MRKLHNLSIKGRGGYVKRPSISKGFTQVGQAVDKAVEIVQNLALSTS